MRFKHFVKPLSGLFRPEAPHAPTSVTAAAAFESASPEALLAATTGDGAAAVRTAAVKKLPDGEPLRKLAGLSEDASTRAPSNLERVAQERMAELIDEGAVDFAALRASSKNIDAVLSVAAICGTPAHLQEAFAAVEDAEVARLVVEGSSSRLRQLAAQRIEDPAELKQLQKLVRDRDKSVYKIIKQKCDVLRAEERRIAQIESDVVTACESLERHSHRIYDAIYEPSFRHFDERWRSLEEHAPASVRERAQRAVDRCREIISGHFRQLEEQATEKAHRAELLAAREEASLHAAEEARRRGEAAASAAAEAAVLREAQEKARADILAAEALALRQIGALIGKANGALREGDTGRAAGLRRAIEEKLAAMTAVPPHLAAQVQQLDVKLKELKEWKDYAVAPKRAELIEEMEGLIGSSEAPQALADRIKELQEDWKIISKGIVIDSEADWQRFHKASQAAYQPCRLYFEAQAKLRHDNVENRKAVLERLRAFEAAQSGEHPDWRAVATVLREAPREWRRHSPVERAAGRAIQEEFDASMERLQARLDSWHSQNVAEKKSLIERAQKLRAKEDGREATDAAKRLQQLWKEIGPAPRDEEQRLWDDFRRQCDAVYQKRQQAHAEYAAGLEANRQRAVALCEEAESFAALPGPALLEGLGKIAPWRAAFESLGEMPRADQRTLHDRFERALGTAQARVSQQRAHDKEHAVANLLEAARRIGAYGWAVALDGASAEREALKQEAEIFIAGVSQWPKGGAQALKDAWAAAAAASPDVEAHEKALRMLCIRSEILTDRPTPPEDQALRREYQVQRLVKHMGRPNEANADDLDALALEWVRVGPVAAAAHESLLSRFLKCR
jgi:hypothetical protein